MQQAVCVRRKTIRKKNAKSRCTKNTPRIRSSPATATTSRRRATKHVPRFSPYSPASIDPGFVEIGLVQLSQSVKTTNVTHTDRQTDTQTNKIMAPCTHPGMKSLFCLEGKRPRSLRSLGLAAISRGFFAHRQKTTSLL